MYINRHAGTSHNQHNKMSAIDHLEKVKEEINMLQTQLHNSRMETEKANQEKDALQRQYMMYHEIYLGLNIEFTKQMEISKRLNGILGQVLPHLPIENQASVIQAAERAKQISPQEIQAIMGSQMHQQQFGAGMIPGMAGLGTSMLNPGAPFNPLAMAAAGLKNDDAFLNLLKNSGAMPMFSGINAAAAASLLAPPIPTTSAGLHASLPGTSASGPTDDASKLSRSGSRAASSRLRSNSPNGSSATPSLLQKKAKQEVEDNDGELEIDVQNDVDMTSNVVQQHTNGASLSHKKDGRESAHSASSRDSTTPQSRKRLSTPNNNMLPPGFPPELFYNAQGRPNPLMDRMLFNIPANGGISPYSFKIIDGGQPEPVSFPQDVTVGFDIPRDMKRVFELPHGDVVCSVAISKESRKVYTGAKGSIKVWDIGQSAVGFGGEVVRQDPIFTLDGFSDCYIRSLKLIKENCFLIVAGESNELCIWDLEKQIITTRLDCESQACYAIAVSEDNKSCFACCADGNIIFWDLVTEKKVYTLMGHSDGVSCLDFFPSGQRICSGSLDKTVRTWDIRAQKELEKYDFDCQIFSLSCSPTDEYVAVGMENNKIEVLSTCKKEKYQLTSHEGCVLALKYAHSGKWFVSSGKDNCLNTWRAPYGFRLVKTKENASVLSCDISNDDKFIVTGSGDKKASVYEVGY